MISFYNSALLVLKNVVSVGSDINYNNICKLQELFKVLSVYK